MVPASSYSISAMTAIMLRRTGEISHLSSMLSAQVLPFEGHAFMQVSRLGQECCSCNVYAILRRLRVVVKVRIEQTDAVLGTAPSELTY